MERHRRRASKNPLIKIQVTSCLGPWPYAAELEALPSGVHLPSALRELNLRSCRPTTRGSRDKRMNVEKTIDVPVSYIGLGPAKS